MSFSIQMALAQVVSSARKSIEEKGIDLYKEVDLAIPLSVDGKQLMLTHVLHTLISEAARQLARGRINLKADLLHIKKENVIVGFTISYSGASLTPKYGDASGNNYSSSVIDKIKNLVKSQGGVFNEIAAAGGKQYQFSLPYLTEQVLETKTISRSISLNEVFSNLSKKFSPAKNAFH